MNKFSDNELLEKVINTTYNLVKDLVNSGIKLVSKK